MVLASLQWAAVPGLINAGTASAVDSAVQAVPPTPSSAVTLVRLAMFFGIIALILILTYCYDNRKGAK